MKHIEPSRTMVVWNVFEGMASLPRHQNLAPIVLARFELHDGAQDERLVGARGGLGVRRRKDGELLRLARRDRLFEIALGTTEGVLAHAGGIERGADHLDRYARAVVHF